VQNIVVKGGARLTGEVRVSGAKNAALPILASSLLASGRSVYRNVPALGDVRTMDKLLGERFSTSQRRCLHRVRELLEGCS